MPDRYTFYLIVKGQKVLCPKLPLDRGFPFRSLPPMCKGLRHTLTVLNLGSSENRVTPPNPMAYHHLPGFFWAILAFRKDHPKHHRARKWANYFRQPWWIAGMSCFLVGQAANIPAMAFAPQTMLSCLGGLALVALARNGSTVSHPWVMWEY